VVLDCCSSVENGGRGDYEPSPCSGLRGLLLAAGHPGVMLAPAIGHAIAGYILDGRQVPPLRALP